MNVMRAVSLHEVRKAARAPDAGDGGNLLVPYLPLFDELEVKRQHREVAATGAPCRVIGSDFFFGEALAFVGQQGHRRNARQVSADRDFSGRTHDSKKLNRSMVTVGAFLC